MSERVKPQHLNNAHRFAAARAYLAMQAVADDPRSTRQQQLLARQARDLISALQRTYETKDKTL
jgi:hypothetical protein